MTEPDTAPPFAVHVKVGSVYTRADPLSVFVGMESQAFGPVVSSDVPHAVSVWTLVPPPLHVPEQLHAEHVRPSTSAP